MSTLPDCLYDISLGRVGYGIRWTAFVRLVFLFLRSKTSGRDNVKPKDLMPLAVPVLVSARAAHAGTSLPMLDRISLQLIMLESIFSMGFFQSRRRANLKTFCHLALQALFLGLGIFLYFSHDSDPRCATQGVGLKGIHMTYTDLLASSHVLSWIYVISLVVLVALGTRTQSQARHSQDGMTRASSHPRWVAFWLCIKWFCFIVTIAIFGLDMCLVVAGWDGSTQIKFLSQDLAVLVFGLSDLDTRAHDEFPEVADPPVVEAA